MHPEIEALLENPDRDYDTPTTICIRNAGKILDYIGDINLERENKFELTPADSLYLFWNVEDWEFHIECLKTGRILYTFRKDGRGKACGSLTVNEFVPHLQNYLLQCVR